MTVSDLWLVQVVIVTVTIAPFTIIFTLTVALIEEVQKLGVSIGNLNLFSKLLKSLLSLKPIQLFILLRLYDNQSWLLGRILHNRRLLLIFIGNIFDFLTLSCLLYLIRSARAVQRITDFLLLLCGHLLLMLHGAIDHALIVFLCGFNTHGWPSLDLLHGAWVRLLVLNFEPAVGHLYRCARI